MRIPDMSIISDDSNHAATYSSLAMISFGIPLTSSISAGFTIGFMKGRRYPDIEILHFIKRIFKTLRSEI
jgi:hypothetical protein